LIQGWFSLAHPGRSPYRLYALSNVGSLLALVSYPFLVEPNLTRLTQARVWSAGLILYVALCGAAAVQTWRSAPAAPAGVEPGRESVKAGRDPSGLWTLWFLLPMCGSVLLLAVTNKICQDVAVVPFLWVLPLSLYLLSFVIAFDSPRWYWRPVWLPAMAAALGAVSWLMLWADSPSLVTIVTINVTALFVCCMVCHGELYRLRPAPRHLTGFYLMIAAGGAFGGLFVALVAPQIFTTYYELHLGWIGCAALLLAVLFRDPQGGLRHGRPGWAWGLILPAFAGLGWVMYEEATQESELIVSRTRNFYGVLTVLEYDTDSPEWHRRLLQHGGTTHGTQYQDPAKSRRPTTYYGKNSGIGRLMRLYPKTSDRRIGVVGLGTGTVLAYGQNGDRFRIYEINPEVPRIARESFTYLSNSFADVEIVLGDGRLSLEREPPQQFDMLILDAFSSDSVPVHLLTREAFEIYRRHVGPQGVIVVHVSNRYLNLQPVVQRVAQHFDYDLVYIDDEEDESEGTYNTDYLLLTNNTDFLGLDEVIEAAAEPDPPSPRVRLWTDEDSNLFRVLLD
jgi:hypothetical protein